MSAFYWVKSRTGNVFLLFMVVVAVVGGIEANQLVENYPLISQRMNEEALFLALGEMRMAITLERFANATPLFQTDWDVKLNLVDYLQKIAELGYLRKIPIDPMTRGNWGLGPGQAFWLPTRNWVASSGFEVDDLNSTAWKLGSTDIVATITDSSVWGGDALGGRGHSVVLIKP